jgi:hypothetical protein
MEMSKLTKLSNMLEGSLTLRTYHTHDCLELDNTTNNQAVGFAGILIDIFQIHKFFSSFVCVQIVNYEAQVELHAIRKVKIKIQ